MRVHLRVDLDVTDDAILPRLADKAAQLLEEGGYRLTNLAALKQLPSGAYDMPVHAILPAEDTKDDHDELDDSTADLGGHLPLGGHSNTVMV